MHVGPQSNSRIRVYQEKLIGFFSCLEVDEIALEEARNLRVESVDRQGSSAIVFIYNNIYATDAPEPCCILKIQGSRGAEL